MDLYSMYAKSDRVVVRALRKEDFAVFVEGFRNSLPSLNRFDDGQFDTSFMDLTWYERLLERREKDANEDFCYVFNIFLKDTGESIGYCDIMTLAREDFQFAKIGYTILNQYWGRGYATEAVDLLTMIGFQDLGFHRLEAHINLDNPASKRVVTKCGYEFECIRKGFILEDGVWTDNEVYYKNAF